MIVESSSLGRLSMRNQIGSLLIAGLLVGCTGFLDESSPMLGTWIGSGFGLTATPGGVVLDDECNQVVFRLPSPLTYGEHFALTGTTVSSMYAADVGQQWHLAGIATRDSIVATVSIQSIAAPHAWLAPVAVSFVPGAIVPHSAICAL
jgi:hypothetical protein